MTALLIIAVAIVIILVVRMRKSSVGNRFPADAPTISLVASTVSVNEGQTLAVSISRTASTLTSKVTFWTIPGTAVESDYTPQLGTVVTFASGETSKVINIPIATDALFEIDEIFTVRIANPENAVINNNKLIVTITGQGAPSVTVTGVSNASAEEGLTLVHNVTLSAGTGGMFTYSIANVTTSVDDFTLPPTFNNGVTLNAGIITVPNGVNAFTVSIATIEDATVEANETYTLTIGGVSGTGTIVNDDALAAASIASISTSSITEGEMAVFNVSLTAPSVGQSFSFNVSGTATSGVDYPTPLVLNNGVTISGINFIVPAGVTSFTASTLTSNDVSPESSETIVLTIAGVSGTVTIIDNDSTPATISSVSSPSVTEGTPMVFNISLSGPSVGQLIPFTLSG